MHTVEAEKKVNLSLILNLGLDLGEWSASCPKRFYTAEGTIEQRKHIHSIFNDWQLEML